jgi:hypothetical protein
MKIKVWSYPKFKLVNMHFDNDLEHETGLLNKKECREHGVEFLRAGLDLLEDVGIDDRLYLLLQKTIVKIDG